MSVFCVCWKKLVVSNRFYDLLKIGFLGLVFLCLCFVGYEKICVFCGYVGFCFDVFCQGVSWVGLLFIVVVIVGVDFWVIFIGMLFFEVIILWIMFQFNWICLVRLLCLSRVLIIVVCLFIIDGLLWLFSGVCVFRQILLLFMLNLQGLLMICMLVLMLIIENRWVMLVLYMWKQLWLVWVLMLNFLFELWIRQFGIFRVSLYGFSGLFGFGGIMVGSGLLLVVCLVWIEVGGYQVGFLVLVVMWVFVIGEFQFLWLMFSGQVCIMFCFFGQQYRWYLVRLIIMFLCGLGGSMKWVGMIILVLMFGSQGLILGLVVIILLQFRLYCLLRLVKVFLYLVLIIWIWLMMFLFGGGSCSFRVDVELVESSVVKDSEIMGMCDNILENFW